MMLGGWGRFPVRDCEVHTPRNEAAVVAHMRRGRVIARGNGRAYGDSALGVPDTLDMRQFNRMHSFDATTGRLVAESGVLLADVIEAFLPRGWFPAVTPGTKFVTLGGMVAADVHGKNHHRDGSISAFIDWIELIDSEGLLRRCSAHENTRLFEWTIGGMGLTGVILRVAMRLLPVETGWIRQTSMVAPNIVTAIDMMERRLDATYSVAWIDCLAKGNSVGRSVVMLGEHASAEELPESLRRSQFGTSSKRLLSVPCDIPAFLLNRRTTRLFNDAYYSAGARQAGQTLVDWDSYFYPLDAILGWNRIYGRRGFVQFQCALPLAASRDGMRKLLETTSYAGVGSFLAVLKRFGEASGPFSFPFQGYTLALDFPVNTRTLAVLSELDEIAICFGGRFYLAKDSRMTAETLRRSDPRAEAFVRMRQESNCNRHFASAQSERLSI